MTMPKLLLVILPVLFLLLSCGGPDALGRERYKVVERIDEPGCSPERINCTVKVVLLHKGRRLHATALDYKDDAGKIRHCELRVGQSVLCKRFSDRRQEGYDLICGDQLWQGREFTTTGGNEMLNIYREELH